ncbi:class A beta-lactamase-related serine hydrolase [Occultella glacieicola]|uniref:Class A beta-lactamase-related serine hydrolase n=1 Tax=Occultella glacieicola TaxID=2518684 RepID=A0ABY2E098_9MICO|nr:serine hydrolase domain-containing protein [Occultella glacieicola]TDE89198.1 class A beta-lactamase-related serine hydrolase [Occultella glacieicola]
MTDQPTTEGTGARPVTGRNDHEPTSTAGTGLDQELTAALQGLLDASTRSAASGPAPVGAGDPVPGTAGADAVIAHRGRVVARAQAGYATLFAADGALLPAADRRALPLAPVFDLASLTKILTTVTALVQVDAGVLDLDRPVTDALPEFAVDRAHHQVTARHLLTHTSGLPPVLRLWEVPGTREDRARLVLGTGLRSEPGASHAYSCVGFMVLGLLLEHLTARDLPTLLRDTVTGPLAMSSTGYDPSGAGESVVPTEYQSAPDRGLVRGVVHDEAAWSLGGSGNAGAFGTAPDLIRFAAALRPDRPGLLREDSLALLRRDVLPAAERDRVGYGQALGMRLGDATFMGTADPAVIGHTGFTGTSLVIDTEADLTVVLLTNRVQPDRSAFDAGPLRRAVTGLARRHLAQA